MRRRLLNLLTALSLLACAGSAWLWVRGHRLAEEVGVRRADAGRRTRVAYSAENDAGRVTLLRYENVTREQWVYDFFERRSPWGGTYRRAGAPSPAVHIGGGDALRRWDALGFAFLTFRVSPGDYTEVAHAVALPHWVLFLVTGVPPTVRGAKWTRRALRRLRQRPTGHCVRCGYDLTANVSGVCPECGTAVQPRAATPVAGPGIKELG